MEPVILNDDDVVSVSANDSRCGDKTFTVDEAMAELLEALDQYKGSIPNWIWDTKCIVLQPKSDWKKGKIRVRMHMEFVPDDENSELPS
ncbi:MAG: KGK domain-containing protein [Cyanobacteria bacterium P01_A01_bin.84]